MPWKIAFALCVIMLVGYFALLIHHGSGACPSISADEQIKIGSMKVAGC
jgi:hypothetical protein